MTPAQELARATYNRCRGAEYTGDARVLEMRNAWAAYHAGAAWMRTLGIFSDGKPSRDMSRDSLAAERDVDAALARLDKVYGAMAAQLRAKVELLQSDARGWAGLAGSASAEVEATRHERDSLQGMWRRSQDENTQLRDEVDRLKRVAWGVVNNARNTEHDAAQPRWAYVMRATSLGSGSARSLCVEFGRDPDELLTREDAVS
jgi:hypothetical protein